MFLRLPAHALGQIHPIDPDLSPAFVHTAHDDVGVRVVRVVVIHGAPPQTHAEVVFDAPHEIAREGLQVDLVLRRHDEPKLVPLAPNGLCQGCAIHRLVGAIELTGRPVVIDAVTLDVREVQPRRLHAVPAHLDDTRLHDATARPDMRLSHVRNAARDVPPGRATLPDLGDPTVPGACTCDD